jgi:hypothetical protein
MKDPTYTIRAFGRDTALVGSADPNAREREWLMKVLKAPASVAASLPEAEINKILSNMFELMDGDLLSVLGQPEEHRDRPT